MEGSLIAHTAVAARVHVAAADWAAAIRAACAPLIAAGAISGHYADRCVEIVAKEGPYIVIAPGIALAHARPEDGARGLALSAVTLAEPVRFGHPDNDPVDLVFTFASPDSNAHVGLLAGLTRDLAGGLADVLRHASTDDEATAYLREVVGHVAH